MTNLESTNKDIIPKKVFVGMPTYSQMHAQFCISLIYSLRSTSPHTIQLDYEVGESLIPRGRNHISSRFLQSDCTHLLFLDTDLQFNGETIKRLLDHDKDIVCGVYPAKQLKTRYIVNHLDEPLTNADGGLWKVREAGTGAMLIARSVFEKMNSAQDEEGKDGWYQEQGISDGSMVLGYDYFRTGNYNVGKYKGEKVLWTDETVPEGFEFLIGQEHKWYLSEDWYFCQRWIELGGEVFVDPQCAFKHIGQMTYPVQYKDLKEAKEHLEVNAERNGVNIEDL